MHRTNSLNSGTSRLPGLRRSPWRAVCDRCGDGGDGQQADRRQRDGVPGSLFHAVSGNVVADSLDPLAVRQRGGGRVGRRRGAAGAGPQRRARHRARRRRRHDRYRLRVPVRHVRAQRRRPLHLLRQRGVHEHRRAALERDAAGGAYRHDPGRGPVARQCLRHRQERAANRDGAPHSLRGDRQRFQSARPRAQGEIRDGDRGARYIHIFVPCPLGWGSASGRHDQARAPGRRDRPVPVVRSPRRRNHGELRRSGTRSP